MRSRTARTKSSVLTSEGRRVSDAGSVQQGSEDGHTEGVNINGNEERLFKMCHVEWILMVYREGFPKKKGSGAVCFSGHRAQSERSSS